MDLYDAPEEKALLVKIEISIMEFQDGFLGWISRMDF